MLGVGLPGGGGGLARGKYQWGEKREHLFWEKKTGPGQ